MLPALFSLATTIRRNTTRGFDGAGAAVHVVQEQVTSIEGPSSDAPASIELSKYKRAKTTKPAFSGPPEPAPANATFAGLMRPANLTAVQVRAMNEAALVRLAKDLQTAIPLFIATCLYFIVSSTSSRLRYQLVFVNHTCGRVSCPLTPLTSHQSIRSLVSLSWSNSPLRLQAQIGR